MPGLRFFYCNIYLGISFFSGHSVQFTLSKGEKVAAAAAATRADTAEQLVDANVYTVCFICGDTPYRTSVYLRRRV